MGIESPLLTPGEIQLHKKFGPTNLVRVQEELQELLSYELDRDKWERTTQAARLDGYLEQAQHIFKVVTENLFQQKKDHGELATTVEEISYKHHMLANNHDVLTGSHEALTDKFDVLTGSHKALTDTVGSTSQAFSDKYDMLHRNHKTLSDKCDQLEQAGHETAMQCRQALRGQQILERRQQTLAHDVDQISMDHQDLKQNVGNLDGRVGNLEGKVELLRGDFHRHSRDMVANNQENHEKMQELQLSSNQKHHQKMQELHSVIAYQRAPDYDRFKKDRWSVSVNMSIVFITLAVASIAIIAIVCLSWSGIERKARH